MDEDDLTTLYDALKEAVDAGPKEKDPVLWYRAIDLVMVDIIAAGGKEKDDTEIGAMIKGRMKSHEGYKEVTMSIKTSKITDLKETKKRYSDHWRTDIKKSEETPVNLALMIDDPPKYGHQYHSGVCPHCGIQGHKGRDCPQNNLNGGRFGGGRGRGRNGRGRGRGNGRFGGRGRGGRRNGNCYNCGKPNHFARDCPMPRKEGAAVESMFVGCLDNAESIPDCLTCEFIQHEKSACRLLCQEELQIKEAWVDISPKYLSSVEAYKENEAKKQSRWWADYDDSDESDEEYVLSCMVDTPPKGDGDKPKKGKDRDDEPIWDIRDEVTNEIMGICASCYSFGELDVLCWTCRLFLCSRAPPIDHRLTKPSPVRHPSSYSARIGNSFQQAR